MRFQKTTLSILVVVAAGLLAAPMGHAQTNSNVNAGIQFNFSTPGARSLGLGGAFFGLADDATAAYTNPAGLTMLSKAEISFEGRKWEFTSSFTDHGHGYGPATGIGVDNVEGLQSAETSSDTTGLSFLSFVYPGEWWAIALYRHELANYETEYQTQGAYTGLDDTLSRFYPINANMNVDIVNTGISLAMRFSEVFTLGVGASYYDFSMNSVTNRYDITVDPATWEQPGGAFGAPNYADNNVINYQTQTGDDTATGFNVGFLWDLSPKFSMGGVYRQGPEFDVYASNIGGPTSGVEGELFREVNSTFTVPDVYGVGFAYRATDAFTIAFDWARVRYSQTIEWATTVGEDGRIVGNLFPEDLDEATSMLSVDDADELHLGFEFVFVNAKLPVALRAGTWFDPDHKVAFNEDPGNDSNMHSLAALWQPGDDQWHYSFGIGLIFGEHFQLDAAADWADTANTYSLSGVVRF